MTLNAFNQALVALALQYPFSVTSGLRTPTHNRVVGGDPESYHLCALAVDVVMDNPADFDKMKARGARLGLLVLDERNHIHIQPKA